MITKKDRAAAAANALLIMMNEETDKELAQSLGFWAGYLSALKAHSGYLASNTIDDSIKEVTEYYPEFVALYKQSIEQGAK